MDNHSFHTLTPDEAMRLAERYFEAETTEAEEALLKRFAATQAIDDPRFNELRAVMGFTTYSRKFTAHASGQTYRRTVTPSTLNRIPPRRRAKSVRIAAAALFAAVIGITAVTTYTNHQENQCVAYVNGTQVNNDKQVIELMLQSLNEMKAPTGHSSIEEQLNDIFGTLNSTTGSDITKQPA